MSHKQKPLILRSDTNAVGCYVTCRTWCDFVLYTSKGLVIDRVAFDEFYWESLQRNILEFYVKYMLPEIVESDKETI